MIPANSEKKIGSIKSRQGSFQWTSVFFALFLSIFFFSCNQKDTVAHKQTYFSITNFFKHEAELLSKKKVKLDKLHFFENSRDSVHISNPDWAKELSNIAELDINKTAWIGSFESDTALQNGNMVISYHPKTEEISIRLLQIFFNGSTPEKIHIIKVNQNIVYSSRMELWYHTQKGFSIYGKQKILSLLNKEYSIQAKYN